MALLPREKEHVASASAEQEWLEVRPTQLGSQIDYQTISRHHQHHFRETNGGVELTDIVNYAIPFGLIGRLANVAFVNGQVNAIFDFRFKKLESMFSLGKHIGSVNHVNL
jgi:ligand-binding SRPBCC domain-containing protein